MSKTAIPDSSPAGRQRVAMQSSTRVQVLGSREQFRDEYGRRRDPIHKQRLLWRAQAFRHTVHVIPGQTILEIGTGSGLFARQLARVTRGENAITAVTFQPGAVRPTDLADCVEFLTLESWPGPLGQREFDYVVAIDLLDQRNCNWFLRTVHGLLKPGGQVVLYESNPWNPVVHIRRLLWRASGHPDVRKLISRARLPELISQLGFVKILAIYNDFVYAPLNAPLIWLLRNLSLVLENMPAVQVFAGSVFIHCEKPAMQLQSRPAISLCEHASLRGAVSIVIPCHNEEMNVRAVVSEILRFFSEYVREIVLVDDNSQDSTAQVIFALAAELPVIKPVIRTPPNGVGRALADGYKAATGQYILSMDCDFIHLMPEFRELFDAAAQGFDIVFGSRFSRHSVLLNYPFQKIIANRLFHVLAQIAFHRCFRDVTNNLKLMRREVAESLRLTEPGFAANAETGLQPLLMGFSMCEIPISWINRTPDMGVSSFRLAKVCGGYWRVLARLVWQTRFGFRRLTRGPSAAMLQAAGEMRDTSAP